jgi:hypothetical protein
MGRMKFWPILLLLSTPLLAQVDVSAIKSLDEELPDLNPFQISDEEINFQRQNRRFRPLTRQVSLDEINQSGLAYGSIDKGAILTNLETNKNYKVPKSIFIKFHALQDEHGFKYVVNKEGQVKWKIHTRYVSPLKEELTMYVPPHRYTPAPENLVKTEFDHKLSIPPEFSFYVGTVQGDYMADLFEDAKASSGLSNQYGVHFFTEWKLPIKAGVVLHYERTSYKLSDGGQIIYSSPSIGPQFKTKDFEFLGHPLRFQTQFRVSPFAKAGAETSSGETSFKFNSADLLASIERPIENRYGHFVLGLYFQSQWLNIKDSNQEVSVKASNETNKSIGLSFSQVFQ